MAYSEQLAERIRLHFVQLPNVEEREMMGGLTFMYNGKMCVGIIKDELMCRIDPGMYDEALQQNECRPMDFTGRPMKGWVIIGESGIQSSEALGRWIGLALDFNKKAKPYKKRGQSSTRL